MNETEQDKLNIQLCSAIKNGDLKNVKDAIAKGAKINTKDKDGYTPLHWAARKGHLKIVEFLVDKGANIDAPYRDGSTPLHEAAEYGRLNVVEFLISKGANIDATSKNGLTLLWAASKGHLDLNKNGLTPLYLAALKDHPEIVKYLISNGANINAPYRDGFTLLHWAASEGHQDVVESLISKHAYVNAKNINGDTPLHLAAYKGHLEIVQSLIISKGADINAKDEYGYTPLFWAIRKGRLDVVKYLIGEGAYINAKSKGGFIPLHWAAFRGRLDVVKYLTNSGADVHAKSRSGDTPLYWAAHKGHQEIVGFLIKYVLLQDPSVKQSTLTQEELNNYWAKYIEGIIEFNQECNRLYPSAKQSTLNQEELNNYCTKYIEELIKLRQENPGLLDFLYAKSLKEGVKICVQDKSILENILQNEALLKEQYPEYTDRLISQANKCKSVTSLGQSIAEYDGVLRVAGVLSFIGGAVFCLSGYPAAVGIPLSVVGVIAFVLSTEMGWEACEEVSSNINNLNAKQPTRTAGAIPPITAI